MDKKLRWYDFMSINSYWLGINIASGIITPVLLPALVIIFMPEGQKNTYLATVRVVGLAMAMLIQPLAGMLSDRSTSRYGRRRPYILTGALLNVLFLFVVGASTLFIGAPSDAAFKTSFGITTSYASSTGRDCFTANLLQHRARSAAGVNPRPGTGTSARQGFGREGSF